MLGDGGRSKGMTIEYGPPSTMVSLLLEPTRIESQCNSYIAGDVWRLLVERDAS
jgi:hypothetical protein